MTKSEQRDNDEVRMSNAEAQYDEAGETKNYDLEERTANFGEQTIIFAKAIPRTAVTSSLIDQVVRAATSVGANYCEADDSGTKKEFCYRIGICRREARECKHWFRMIATAVPDLKQELRPLWQEAKELNLIFSSILRKANGS